MSAFYQQIITLLTRYMSSVNAHNVLGRAVRHALCNPETLAPRDLEALIPTIDRGIRLFVEPEKQRELIESIEGLGDRVPKASHSVTIRGESDISHARVLAKAMCENARAKTFVTQKVATIVSELARNIVSYTSGGTIELSISAELPTRIAIRAVDTGRGIENLDEVLSGRYKSSTGLGRGLLGVKRLSDRFNVHTGKGGTRVDAEVNL